MENNNQVPNPTTTTRSTTATITTNNGFLPLRSPATTTTTTTVNNLKIVVTVTTNGPTTTFTVTATQETTPTAATAATAAPTAATTDGVDPKLPIPQEALQICLEKLGKKLSSFGLGRQQRNPSPAYFHDLISGFGSLLTPPSPPTSPFAPPSTPPRSSVTPPKILPNFNVDAANQKILTSLLSNSGGTIRTNPDSGTTNDKKLRTVDEHKIKTGSVQDFPTTDDHTD